MNIPDEVIEQAAKAQFEWQDGLPPWEHDADEFKRAEYVRQTQAAAQVGREGARKEALREAAEEAVRSGSEWIDAWQPNAKMRPIEECIAEDIRALAGGDKTGDS